MGKRFLIFTLLSSLLLFSACNETAPTPPTTIPESPSDPDPLPDNPENPTEPSDPTQPSNPTEPSDPTQPSNPTEPDNVRAVLMCDGCKQNVIAVASQEDAKLIDWPTLFFASPGIPAWIVGKEEIPLPKVQTCASLAALLTQTMHAANVYRNYYQGLASGLILIQVSDKGLTSFEANSQAHEQAKAYLYEASNLSFGSAQTLLDSMAKLTCLEGVK